MPAAGGAGNPFSNAGIVCANVGIGGWDRFGQSKFLHHQGR
jgi:hypothetical protein